MPPVARGRSAAPPARAARVDPPARRRPGAPGRPDARRCRRGRRGAGEPPGAGREPSVPLRPLPLGTASKPRGARGAHRAGRALCASLLLHAVPAASARLRAGSRRCRSAIDRLRLQAHVRHRGARGWFPFASADPPLEPDGVLYGLTDSGAPVIVDRFARDELQLRRARLLGRRQVIRREARGAAAALPGRAGVHARPRGRVPPLCEAVGGAYLPLAGPEARRAEPARPPRRAKARALDERILFLADLVELLPEARRRGARGARPRRTRCYDGAGITRRPGDARAGRRRCSRPRPRLAAESESGQAARRAALALRDAARTPRSSTGQRARSRTATLSASPLRGLPERMSAPALMLTLDASGARSRGRCAGAACWSMRRGS